MGLVLGEEELPAEHGRFQSPAALKRSQSSIQLRNPLKGLGVLLLSFYPIRDFHHKLPLTGSGLERSIAIDCDPVDGNIKRHQFLGLCHDAQVSTRCKDVSMQAGNRNVLELSKLFESRWQAAASKLSPTEINEMIPLEQSSDRAAPLRQQLFTSPIIPLIYERLLPPIWAAGLRIGGPDAEYAAAARCLGGDGSGVCVDLSCGTGFVGRRLAKAGTFQHVFALDFSAEMLGEMAATVRREGEQRALNGRLSLIRADAGALPFCDSAVKAVHWGGAMHCVPDAAAALREVYRTLQPGGILYATTFLRPFPDIVFRFFEPDELVVLAKEAGFPSQSISVERRGVYGILKAKK